MTRRIALVILASLVLSPAGAFGQLVIENNVVDAGIIFKVNDGGAPNTEVVRIDGSDRRVGIGGIASPGSPLHVFESTAATSTTAGLTIEQASTGDAITQFVLTGGQRWIVGIDNSDGDKFKISESNDLGTGALIAIDSATDFVGIGAGATSPNYQLDVQYVSSNVFRTKNSATSGGNISTFQNDSEVGWQFVVYGSAYTFGSYFNVGANGSAIVATGSAPMAIGTPSGIPQQPLILGTGGTEAMRIDGTQRVGIGTDAPGAKLHVRSGDEQQVLKLTTSDTSGIGFAMAEIIRGDNQSSPTPDTAGLRISEHSSNYALHIEDQSNNPLFTVNGNGNVGIGTTSPSAKLDVAGTLKAQVVVSEKAANYPVLTTDSRTVFTNEGTTSGQPTMTLPSATKGLHYTFIVQDANGMVVAAAPGDTIRIASDDGVYIVSSTVGSSVVLVAVNATEWIAISSTGTWAAND
jgi:hypothetical protein